MRLRSRRIVQALLLGAIPVAIYAFSGGPPVGNAGVPSDNRPLVCSACHRGNGLNEGAGRVTIQASPYLPGVPQTVLVTVEQPDGLRWGFQMAARLKSDETVDAGEFGSTADVQVRCAPDQRNAPCGTDHQYAMHTLSGTRPGTPARRTFEVPWTPPPRNVGPVVFYVAGNAANSGFSNAGDFIYTSTLEVAPMACNLTGRPSITGVTNAAARGPISSNALIAIFGSGFAPASARYAVTRNTEDWPREFGCVAVEVGGKRAPVFYVQADQINAQAPILDATGQMDVRVILNPGTPNEIRSDAARVQVNPQAPAIFTFDGRVAAAHRADGSLVNAQSPARPGEIVTVYGSGFGFTDPVFQPGEFAFGGPVLRGVTFTLGGQPVSDVLFAGLSSVAPGLYQFNLRVGPNVPDGDAALVARIGGVETASDVVIPVRR